MSEFIREEHFIVVKRKHLTPTQEQDLRHYLNDNGIPTTESVVLEANKPYYEAGWKLVEEYIKNNRTNYEDEIKFIENGVASLKLNLHKSNCELRDERWSIEIDSSDEPCFIRVRHREYGDYYNWPEAVFDDKVKAALRAYDIEEETVFRTRSAALAVGKSFLRRWGAGDVEYLEFDSNSHSMVVVNHSSRRRICGYKFADDTEDPLQKYFGVSND